MCDNCGCGSSSSMMDVQVVSAMAGISDSSNLGTDTTDMTVQSAPKNTIGN
jgi:hypothetical protein